MRSSFENPAVPIKETTQSVHAFCFCASVNAGFFSFTCHLNFPFTSLHSYLMPATFLVCPLLQQLVPSIPACTGLWITSRDNTRIETMVLRINPDYTPFFRCQVYPPCLFVLSLPDSTGLARFPHDLNRFRLS